jgi:drug/metabolite transporter (DMT)-like permease
MGILLALGSAIAYGLTYFVGGLVSRRASAWPVAVLGQLSATACTLVFALGAAGQPTGADLGWGVVAGVGSGLGTGFLYRGMAGGRMAVVSPLSAVGAALLPVLAGAIGGERLSGVVWAGVVLAMPGIWLVASVPQPGVRHPLRGAPAAGVVDGVLSGIGFGLLFAALGQVPDRAGMLPLALAQAVSVPAAVALATLLGASWVPRGRPVRWAVLTGPLGALATGAFLLATHHGYLTISGVLASLYPATTVLLASLVLREPLHRSQGLGLGLCALAVALVVGG